MLLFLFGKDEIVAYSKAKIWKEKICKDLKITENIIFQDKNFNDLDILTYASDISIFNYRNAYFIKLNNEEIFSENQIKEFINSDNLFVILSNNEDLKDIITKQKVKIEFAEHIKKDIFPSEFVNALQKKDKKNSWKLLRELLEEKPAEEIYGVCIFAYKSLFAVVNFKSNSVNSGIKDFSFNNAKKNIKDRIKNLQNKYSESTIIEEVKDTYFKLIKLLPVSRAKNIDLKISLEKWILDN